jgi:hypothetical protein
LSVTKPLRSCFAISAEHRAEEVAEVAHVEAFLPAHSVGDRPRSYRLLDLLLRGFRGSNSILSKSIISGLSLGVLQAPVRPVDLLQAQLVFLLLF